MDFKFSAEENAFRDEVRAFLKSNLPERTARNVAAGREPSRAERVEWQRILNKRGWAVPQWPVEWGGTGWDAVRLYILYEEQIAANVPDLIGFNVTLLGPVMAAFGTPEQKRHFLPRLANGDDWFCQGFSEPGSGSDLASLKTSARRDGDHYVINGQKIWTTQAHLATWMFGLFRTDSAVKKQQGISFLVFDLKTPGITVRPIITLDGLHETNEVFFDNVRVPVSSLVGTENRGWDVAKFLLSNERMGMIRTGLQARRHLQRVKGLAENVVTAEGKLADQDWFRTKVAGLEVDLEALKVTTLRILADMRKNPDTNRPDPRSSMLKLRASETQQAIHELAVQVAGPHIYPYQHDLLEEDGIGECIGPDWVPTVAPQYFFYRVATIYGGSSEVQKNILAKATLGL
jgi:alkylation response protein AidB-like acyl-CoA dehydrogenase